MKIKSLVSLIALTSFGFAGNAVAATADGTLGGTSTGNADITLEIQDRVQVTDLDTIAIGAYGGSGNVVENEDFCVYRNGGDQYRMTITSAGGAFELASVISGDSIPFSVKLDDDADASDGAAVTYNTLISALSGDDELDCGSSNNAAVEVTIPEAGLLAASTASDYTETLILFVEPI